MSVPVSILVPNRRSYEAIELTIESLLARTWYDNFRIIVCDSSQGEGEGNRLAYLQQMERNGAIRLIENSPTDERLPDKQGFIRYGHGENLRVLLRACETPLAMLLSSGCEIIKTNWLDYVLSFIDDRTRDLGAAVVRKAENHHQNKYSASRYVANWMMLNMDIYRMFGDPEEDWLIRRVPFTKYERPEEFAGIARPTHPDPDPLQVFCDTGYRLWDRVHFENPNGYRMAEMPKAFAWNQLRFLGGLDRNSHRPDHPFIMEQRQSIADRLKGLRCQG